jgi:hypothetical protein
MVTRNRSEGWKHAKISGHANENDITNKINNNNIFRENLEKKLNLKSSIKFAEVGGLNEKNVEDIFGGKTKSKTDLKIILKDKKKINISIKKSLGGQVYLIGVDRFLNGFEIQFKKKIDEDIKRAFKLFFSGANDILQIIDSAVLSKIEEKKKIKIKKYEKRKKRITWLTFEEYNLQLSLKFIEWFKQNINDIFLFCFERGLSNNKEEWADFIWYKNELMENEIDFVFDIKKMYKTINNNQFKQMIVQGSTLGGTTLKLPFGFVQWHQSQIQFHHNFELMNNLSK